MKISKSHLHKFGKFFALGILTSTASFLISIYWSTLYTLLTDKDFVFDFQPKPLKVLNQVMNNMSRQDFDRQKWGGAEATNDPVRIHMVDDLLKKRELKGLKKPEIIELLGVPQRTNYFREYDYVYWLGPERGFLSIDSEWLGIKFENDVVIDVRLLRD